MDSKSRKVSAGTRVYYFDVNTDSKGQRFISVSEIPTDIHPGTKKKRQRIFIHAQAIGRFIEALQATAKDMENGEED